MFVGSVKKNKQKLKPTIVQLAGRSLRAAVVWGSGGGRFKPLALFPCVLLSIGEEGGRGCRREILGKRVRCWKGVKLYFWRVEGQVQEERL